MKVLHPPSVTSAVPTRSEKQRDEKPHARRSRGRATYRAAAEELDSPNRSGPYAVDRPDARAAACRAGLPSGLCRDHRAARRSSRGSSETIAPHTSAAPCGPPRGSHVHPSRPRAERRINTSAPPRLTPAAEALRQNAPGASASTGRERARVSPFRALQIPIGPSHEPRSASASRRRPHTNPPPNIADMESTRAPRLMSSAQVPKSKRHPPQSPPRER
jgi:hypothetical protein